MTAKIQINVSVIRLFKWKENGKKNFFFYINDDDDDDDLNRVIRSRTIRKKKLWSSVCVCLVMARATTKYERLIFFLSWL